MSNEIGLSGTLWPIHLKPYPNEILSSWMVRLAHANGLKVHTFYSLVLGHKKNIWNRDIDKSAPEWLLETLCSFTGTSPQDIFNTTLRSYEGVLYEKHQSCGNTQWLNPLGLYHRVHNDYGLQFCPICLGQDMDPYYRKFWRLGFYTECEKHHILLHDRCPDCGKAVNFHRVELGKKNKIKPKSLSSCYECDFDLRLSPKIRIECSDWQTVIMYRTLLDFHEEGWSLTDNLVFNYSHQLFDVLRSLCVFLSSRRSNLLLKDIQQRLGINSYIITTILHSNFEKRSVIDRHILLLCSLWLILKWPSRFLEMIFIHKIRYTDISRDHTDLPYWYQTVLDCLNHSSYSPNSEEMNSAAHYLLKTENKVGITKISRALGYTTLKR
jgi:hypothetical protein